MISKQLEHILVEFAGCTPGEMTQRFQKTRDCGLLPKSRGEHAEPLSNEQIASAVLGVVPERPGYAGLNAKILSNLRPVGGPAASFCGAETLSAAVAVAIERPDEILELEVLDGEFGVNSYGYAAIHHKTGTTHYVHQNALSLMQHGAERDFDRRKQIRNHEIQRWLKFSTRVFKTISRKVRDARECNKLIAEFAKDQPAEQKILTASKANYRIEQAQSVPRRSSQFVSIAVHSSVGMEKPEYYFLYKGIEFKFVPNWRKSESDALTGRFPTNWSEEKCYKLMTEFLSVFSFERDAKLVLSFGIIAFNDFSLGEYTGCYLEKRRIPVEELLEDFCYIPPVRNEIQSTLIRLYRQARAANDVYSGLLFYWQVIVYPSSDDNDGVTWIDKIRGGTAANLSHVNEEIDRLLKNPLFAPNSTSIPSLGAYIKDGIRHSIAHIVRSRPNSRNIDIDQIGELRHLNDARTILHCYSRYRLEHEFGLREPHDIDIFRYFKP